MGRCALTQLFRSLVVLVAKFYMNVTNIYFLMIYILAFAARDMHVLYQL